MVATATEFGWGGQETDNKHCCLQTTFGSESLSVLSDSLFMDQGFNLSSQTHARPGVTKKVLPVCSCLHGSAVTSTAPPCSLSFPSRDASHPGGLCEQCVSAWEWELSLSCGGCCKSNVPKGDRGFDRNTLGRTPAPFRNCPTRTNRPRLHIPTEQKASRCPASSHLSSGTGACLPSGRDSCATSLNVCRLRKRRKKRKMMSWCGGRRHSVRTFPWRQHGALCTFRSRNWCCWKPSRHHQMSPSPLLPSPW